MAGTPIGLAVFPGVLAVESATYTLSHGITPGVCTMQIAPQDANTLAAGGPLVFTFNDVTLIFPDCKIDLASLRYDTSGAVVTLNIIDRRWKWAFGQISGQFNQREWDGTILDFHERTPQELATLCLEAMGEVDYDVSQLPNDTRPCVTWNVITPAQALADLCEQLGCRVVLTLNATVAICRPGVGEDLPTSSATPIDNFGQSINPPERPDSMIVICSKSRHQVDLPLEAVVHDFSGLPVPYQQASYKPAAGWLGVTPGVCSQITGAPFGRSYDLAVESFCRWYRIQACNLDFSTPLDLPGYGPVQDFRQLTILPDQVLKFVDNDGSIRPVPAWLYGSFISGGLEGAFVNAPLVFGDTPQTLYWRGFNLDPDKGLVILNDYAYQLNAAKQVIPADLILRTSVNVVSYDAWEPSRYQRRKDYGTGFGTQPRYLLHDEIEYQTVPNYDADGNVTTVTDNSQVTAEGLPGVNSEADYYLAAIDLQYQTTEPLEISYLGLVPISPDGAIQQVTWTVGTRTGARTQAGRNNEFSPFVPPYRQRRLFEQLRSGVLGQVRQSVAVMAAQGLVPGRNGL